MVGLGLPETFILGCVAGLLLVLVRSARQPGSAPAAPLPAAGSAAVPRVAAGCGLVAMIPLALVVAYFALPEWQRLGAAGKVGVAQYLSVVFAVVLFVALSAWLVRVIGGPKPVDATANPVPPGRRLVGLIVVGTLLGL